MAGCMHGFDFEYLLVFTHCQRTLSTNVIDVGYSQPVHFTDTNSFKWGYTVDIKAPQVNLVRPGSGVEMSDRYRIRSRLNLKMSSGALINDIIKIAVPLMTSQYHLFAGFTVYIHIQLSGYPCHISYGQYKCQQWCKCIWIFICPIRHRLCVRCIEVITLQSILIMEW